MEPRKATRDESTKELFVQANKEWDRGNAKLAFKLFSQAAVAGHASAKNSVGYFLDHGLGIRKNRSQALMWYRRAARQGDLSAYSNIAASYRNAGDTKRAKIWFEKAVAKGDGGAAADLARLLLDTNKETHRMEALRLLKAAVKSKYISEEDRYEATRLLEELTHG